MGSSELGVGIVDFTEHSLLTTYNLPFATHQIGEYMGKPHEQLDAWKYAMQLVKAVYQLTADFPPEERYGLTSQMRRAAVSIPSNIAEGAGRNGEKEFINFIGISRGSLAELETQLQLAVMLSFTAPDHPAFELANSTGKLLTGLHKKLKANVPLTTNH